MGDADARTTLSVLNAAREWFGGGRLKLRYEENNWHMVHGGVNDRRLNVYVSPETDIRDTWRTLYADKPFPLAACDDQSVPDPGVLLLQAESRFRIHVYWFSDDDEIDDWGVYTQPISKLMHSMRVRARWAVTLLLWHRRAMEKTYRPEGKGAKRARDSFEENMALACGGSTVHTHSSPGP